MSQTLGIVSDAQNDRHDASLLIIIMMENTSMNWNAKGKEKVVIYERISDIHANGSSRNDFVRKCTIYICPVNNNDRIYFAYFIFIWIDFLQKNQ